MFKKKRKLRKIRQRKRAIKKVLLFLAYAGIIYLSGSVVYYLYTSYAPKQSYISPLARVAGIKTESAKDYNQLLLEKELRKKHIAFLSVDARDDLYIVRLPDDAEVTFSSKKDIITQISSLQFILSRLTMEGKLFSRLDLRFDKPVIVLKEK